MKSTTPEWYAVYTKPKWEKKVAELFLQKNIQHYCPINKVVKQWHDRRKWVDEPLFTSYVFICINPAQRVDVLKTPGVLNFVYWLRKPAVIRAEEIEQIKAFLATHQNVQVQKAPLEIQDQVRIVSSALLQQEGTVVEVHNHTVKVLLPSLGAALLATVEKQNVEVAAPVEQAR
jgi:transcription antitermination factor NusG